MRIESREDFRAAEGSPANTGALKRLHKDAQKARARGRTAEQWLEWARKNRAGDVSLISENQLAAILAMVWP